MRKVFSVFISLMIITCAVFSGACAEQAAPSIWELLGVGTATEAPTMTPQPTVTPSPDDFRFRDGIRWGMNPQQVKSLESVNMVERVLQDWSIMVTTEKVAVSRFTADLVFIFRQEQLKMIVYEFQRKDAVNPGRYQADKLTKANGWLTSDGTAVFQYQYAPDSFGVMYVAPELGGGLYQTNGL